MWIGMADVVDCDKLALAVAPHVYLLRDLRSAALALHQQSMKSACNLLSNHQ
jgi:hypothetical protein